MSANCAYELVPKVQNLYALCTYISTELPLCIAPLLVGYSTVVLRLEQLVRSLRKKWQNLTKSKCIFVDVYLVSQLTFV